MDMNAEFAGETRGRRNDDIAIVILQLRTQRLPVLLDGARHFRGLHINGALGCSRPHQPFHIGGVFAGSTPERI